MRLCAVELLLAAASGMLSAQSYSSRGLAGGAGSAPPRAAAGYIKIPLLEPVSVLLEPNECKRIVVTNISSQTAFVIAQVYTHMQDVMVSLSPSFPADASYTSPSAGVVLTLTPATFFIRAGEEMVSAVLFALSYTALDPIPGACNTEFSLENDPNLHLTYDRYETAVTFAPANLGTVRQLAPPACDVKTDVHTRWRLTYDIYQYFLPESDLTMESLSKGMNKMSSVQEIERNGIKITTRNSFQQSITYGNSYIGTGVIYNVIVRDPHLKTSASYAPVSTYACSLSSEGYPCKNSANFTIFRNDINFWIIFCCVMLVVPTVLILRPRALNIITCALVGSYAVIVAIGVYVYTSLTYIVLNVIKRTIHPDFAKVESDAPFQRTDFILTSIWAMLFVSGVSLQFILERNRLPFPPCPYDNWRRRRNTTYGERTPLLRPPDI
ncbi:transmembrane 7 superfamily member 3-like isoform X3 [Scyliorhinus torazame]|uniref:transmembrane 7 superfamily member 3-like isoform X3 n=1 Tax=Scyliorhinus torazame TaxID=75743 RepID=UPI003B5B46D7